MTEQEFFAQTTSSQEDDVDVPQTSPTTPMDMSELLDAIDGVLEKNATEFVRNFVQKGGQ